jgi:hypothetical protein
MSYSLPLEQFVKQSGLSEETIQRLVELGILNVKTSEDGRFIESPELFNFLKDTSIHSEVEVSTERQSFSESRSDFSTTQQIVRSPTNNIEPIEAVSEDFSDSFSRSLMSLFVEKLAFKTEQCKWLQSEVERLKAELAQSREILLEQSKALTKVAQATTTSWLDKVLEALGLTRRP